MTFKKFEELFLTRYPDGEVVQHGKMGGTERNNKTAVIFKKGGKVYDYYGAYEDILNKVGIKTISKSRLYSIEETLKNCKEDHGKEDIFFGTGIIDNSKEIAQLESYIKDIKENYIIV